MSKTRFRDLSPRGQALIIVMAIVQISLNAAAQIDITRRSPAEVRGSKLRWRLVSMINFAGPLAYFRWGRLPRYDA